MAKKRASLKGKGVGGSEEKGRGIDLLFGSTAEGEDTDAGNLVIDATPESPEVASRSAPSATPVAAPPPPPSGAAPPPAPTPTSSDVPIAAEVDEFGFPVASETPPADLELASATFSEPPPPAPSEEPPSDLDLSGLDIEAPLETPLPTPALETAVSDLPPDLANMPTAGEAPPPDLDLQSSILDDLPESIGESNPDEDLINAPPPPDDLSLSGIDLGDPTGVTEPGGVPIDTGVPPSGTGTDPFFVEPPIIEPPIVEPPIVEPPIVEPPIVEPPITPGSTPGSYGPTVPTPPMVAVPRARIESVSGIATEKIYVDDKDILPEDTKYGGTPISGVLTVAERAQVEQNELITQRVTRYIGRERREKLDREIEDLYGEVATELSANKEDSEFALRVLSQAQDIIFEDARQYDEALYRVAVVRTMIARKRNLRRWSYTWGYCRIFLCRCLAGRVSLSAFYLPAQLVTPWIVPDR